MPSKYLDSDGLSYYHEKLKTKIDNELVHKTGNETIEGVKTFQNTAEGHTAGETVTDLVIRNPEVDRGSPVEAGRSYTRVILADAEGDTEETYSGRLGLLEVVSPKENDTIGEQLRLGCYRFSDDSADHGKSSVLSVGYDVDGVPYSSAPVTSGDRTNSNDIITRGYMEASEWNWQKTKKNALVQFKPVPESDLEPVVDFMFTETPPASGEKGPSNPSTIMGVSSAKVTRCGKNILPSEYAASSMAQRGITVTNNVDGSYHFSGTSSSSATPYMYFFSSTAGVVPDAFRPGEYFTISIQCDSPEVLFRVYISDSATAVGNVYYTAVKGSPKTFTISDTTKTLFFSLIVNTGKTIDCDVRCQIEYGKNATEWETPSDNNYTIQLGNTYYGGSLDVATGVMTVTWVGGLVPVKSYQYHIDGIVGFQWDYSGTPRFPGNSATATGLVCTHFPNSTDGSQYSERINFTGGDDGSAWGGYIHISDTRIGGSGLTNAQYLSNMQQYITNNNVMFAAKVYTPFTVQLTSQQIKALPALDKYVPHINTVYTDQEAVQVGYQRYVDESNTITGKANDSEVVHKTGDEIIQGEKVFKNEKVYSTTGNHISNISIRNPAVERGTATSLAGGKRVYSNLYFLDNEGLEERPYSGRLATLEYCAPSTSDLQEFFTLTCYDYFSENGADNARLSLGYDLDRIPYATAPATSDDRTNSTDIVTRCFMESSEWNWQKTKKIGAVAFKPVPESDLEPVVDFKFTETPPVSGVKGPENPSTIMGISSIDVGRCGKNLLVYPYVVNSYAYSGGLTATANSDGSVKINGTASGPAWGQFSVTDGNSAAGGNPSKIELAPGVQYTASLKIVGGSVENADNLKISVIDHEAGSVIATCAVGSSVTFTPIHRLFRARLEVAPNVEFSDVTVVPLLELGSTTTSFEPYTGNDYTLSLGSTYYGGSLDVATGVMTVTHVGTSVSNMGRNSIGLADSWFAHESGTHIFVFYFDRAGLPNGVASSTPDYTSWICTHFRNPSELTAAGLPHINFFTSASSGVAFYIDIEESKLNLSGAVDPANPTNAELDDAVFALASQEGWFVVYPVAESYTVQLTPTQIRSLPALDKYEPRINTVYTDQEAVQVGYQRYVGNRFWKDVIIDKTNPTLFLDGSADSTRDDIQFRVENQQGEKKVLAAVRLVPTGTLMIGRASDPAGYWYDGAHISMFKTGGMSLYVRNNDGSKSHVLGLDLSGSLLWDNKDITGDVHTTGDETINGVKTFSSIKLTGNVSANNNTGSLWIGGGNSADSANGAVLGLYGIDRTDASKGRFSLFASTGNSAKPYYILDGKSNGTLTWDSKDITGDVHTTGTETIGGEKTFTNYLNISRTTPVVNIINTSQDSGSYCDLRFRAAGGEYATTAIRDVYQGNLIIGHTYQGDTWGSGALLEFYYSSGNFSLSARAGANGTIRSLVGTPSGALTWNNKDITGDVHTTGDETIHGSKTFSSIPSVVRTNPYIWLCETDSERGVGVDSGATSYSAIAFMDKNKNAISHIGSRFYGTATDKHISTFLVSYDGTDATSNDVAMVCLLNWNVSTGSRHSFFCEPSGDVLLGQSGRKWKEVWCVQSSINSSSDERLKSNITNLSDEVLDAWGDIDWVQYQFNDAIKEKGENARLHVGAVAQAIDRVFKSKNLDITKYGLFLYDEWDETPEARDKNGTIIQHYQAAGNEYGIRYAEALCMEAAYQRRRAERAEKRINDLENNFKELMKEFINMKNEFDEMKRQMN